MGLGITGSLPLLFASAEEPKHRARAGVRLAYGAMPSPRTAFPAYGFPDPAGPTNPSMIPAEPDPNAPDLTGPMAYAPAQAQVAQRRPSGAAQLSFGNAPLIHAREEWQARPPRQPAVLLPTGPDHIVIHNTQTPNSDDLSLAHALQLSRKIQYSHMHERGWDDIGEQLTISRGGYVMEGRNRSLPALLAGRNVMGSQTLSQNDHTIGIENEGSYAAEQVPPLLWASLVQVCGWLCHMYNLNPYHAIVGHRDYVDYTDCPGDVLYGRLPELRRKVAQGLLLRQANLPQRPAAAVQQRLPLPR
jgi:N-acetylmuramoyl-L-alanine amidase